MAMKIKVGIVGGTGYVAGELLRVLTHHPFVEFDFIYSQSQAGKNVGSVHGDLFGLDLTFSSQINPEVDVLFLCLGHGHSTQFLTANSLSEKTVIIDLSNDFRLEKDSLFQGKKFTYGLVAKNKNEIANSKAIANPGCFATAIQHALLPLATVGELKKDVHVHAITGSTGAGASLSETAHFSYRNNNDSLYKAFNHQHMGEIQETLVSLQENFSQNLHFLPIRGAFTRGIFAFIYMETDLDESELIQLYKSYFAHSAFVKISSQPIHLKQVVNTNFNLLQIEKINGKVLITSVLDNLLMGAAGQAVQNMNLLFSFPETEGLNLKANFF
ncbi:MAG: N-acetyl-gamma-glutamyl-phosphate reductase [Crocinitomicaceae bacterium]|jgi:N-acetyl-gamma-glutamyl-phosphate reductase|nr:N-acetyl-gamma-glutamyl-phosphate reductase [Crocinitomicaceae bacterium]